jgi:O-antigen/teichoic acid export membrane protein
MIKQLAYIINYSISKLFPALLSLLFFPIIVRFLDVKQYAELNINTQLFNLLNTILLLTTYYIQRHFKRNPSCLNEAMGITIQLSICITLLFVIINYIIFNKFNLLFSIIVTANYILLGIYQNNMTALNALEESKVYATYQVFYSLFKTIFSILFVFLTNSYIGVFLGMLVPLLFINKRLINVNQAKIGLSFYKIDISILKKYLSFGIPLATFSSLDIILGYSDVLIIKHLLGIELSGYYSGIYNILSFTVLFPQSVLVLWGLPKLIKIVDIGNYQRAKKLLIKIIMLYFIFTLLLILLFNLCGNEIFSLLLTSDYSKYYRISLILIPGLFFAGLMKILVMLYQAINRKFYLVNITVAISILFNIILNLLLVPSYKLVGASLATFLSYLLVNVILIMNTRDLLTSTKSEKADVKVI